MTTNHPENHSHESWVRLLLGVNNDGSLMVGDRLPLNDPDHLPAGVYAYHHHVAELPPPAPASGVDPGDLILADLTRRDTQETNTRLYGNPAVVDGFWDVTGDNIGFNAVQRVNPDHLVDLVRTRSAERAAEDADQAVRDAAEAAHERVHERRNATLGIVTAEDLHQAIQSAIHEPVQARDAATARLVGLPPLSPDTYLTATNPNRAADIFERVPHGQAARSDTRLTETTRTARGAGLPPAPSARAAHER